MQHAKHNSRKLVVRRATEQGLCTRLSDGAHQRARFLAKGQGHAYCTLHTHTVAVECNSHFPVHDAQQLLVQNTLGTV